jgi:hypothetical protein
MKTPLLLRYFIWTMLIFAISMGLWSFRGLRSLELKALNFASMPRYGSLRNQTQEADSPFLVVQVFDQLSQEQYLNLVRDVLHNLRPVGAKAVIVPLPDLLRPTPRVANTILEIAADSTTILGVSSPPNTSLPWFNQVRLDDKKSWWVEHPLPKRQEVSWGALTATSEIFSPLTRFIPTGYRESNSGGPVSDVVLLALKRYFDIREDIEVQPNLSRLQVGPLSIQIARDGISYVKSSFFPNRGSEVYAAVNPANDSVVYYPTWGSQMSPAKSIAKAWEAHRGKIVLINWAGVRSYRYPGYDWSYMMIFGSLFKHSSVTIHNEWMILLITSLVVLLSVFSYTFRNSLTIALSLALSVGFIVLSVWLFNKYDILFEPIYSIAAILLSGFILPIVKLAGEKHLAAAKIKSLEEENRRLIELHRPTPPGTHS